jgi:hypothetical protein
MEIHIVRMCIQEPDDYPPTLACPEDPEVSERFS